MKNLTTILWAVLALSFTIVSCVGGEADDQAEVGQEVMDELEIETAGALAIRCNGEDFVRSGFVSVDGWNITFRHLYVTITDISVYQTDPPYDPHSTEEISGDVQVDLDGIFTVDLALGDQQAETILIGEMDSVPAGHYNAMSWNMVPALEGPSEGYTIYIDAQAEKGDESYSVYLGIENSYTYFAGEFVGDVRKGFVTAEEPGELEMTFHFDHIFGDFHEASDSDLNMMAVGFEPFAEMMEEGTVSEDLTSLREKMSEEIYLKLMDTFSTLGHTGEGHCYCIVR